MSAERITTEELAAVRALDAAATPGPWDVTGERETAPRVGPLDADVFRYLDADNERMLSDLAIVALLRTLGPELAREVERLTAEMTRAKADLLDIAERAIRQRDAAEAARDALREKARIVCEQYDPDDPTVLDPAAVYALRAEISRS